ncbi:MAG: Na-translocating system protein MpsC family protein [Solirubrobacteraceae bacterium]
MRLQEEMSGNVADGHDAGASVSDRSPMLEISNAMVRLYKDAFGRGPTKARAQFAGQDTLVVMLESSLTVAERNLVAMGEHQRLREARLFFQYALEDQFRAIVEQALGRRTVAFVSGIDTARDVAMEVFTLEPLGNEDTAADA